VRDASLCVNACVCVARAGADYDSGWFDMSAGVSTFVEKKHDLGVIPEQTQVLVKPKFGSLAGLTSRRVCCRVTPPLPHPSPLSLYSVDGALMWMWMAALCVCRLLLPLRGHVSAHGRAILVPLRRHRVGHQRDARAAVGAEPRPAPVVLPHPERRVCTLSVARCR
jgi:hypothetical protein